MKKRKAAKLRFRLISLNRGLVTAVSPEDFDRVSKYTWHAVCIYGRWAGIVTGSGKGKLYLHRLIMRLRPTDQREVDHWNRCTFDNRRVNLRVCSKSGNMRNRRAPRKGWRGCYPRKGKNRFYAMLRYMGRGINLGNFRTKREAALAYDAAGRKMCLPGLVPNFPKRDEIAPRSPRCLVIQRPDPVLGIYLPRRGRPTTSVGVYRRTTASGPRWDWKVVHRRTIRAGYGFRSRATAVRARELCIRRHRLPNARNKQA